jgi:hypothetical protein
MVHMGFDFSALDAELAALGAEPAEVLQLAARYLPEFGAPMDLAAADRALAELGQLPDLSRLSRPRLELTRLPEPELDEAPLELADDELDISLDAGSARVDGDDLPTPPPPRPQGKSFPPAAPEPRILEVGGRQPESGEMALPEPVKRAPNDPVSGELTLVESEPPTSGSFALPANDGHDAHDEEPVFTADVAPSTPPRSERPVHLTGVRTYSEGPELSVDALSDEDEDPDTQAVFAAFDQPPSPPAPSGETRLKGLSDLPAALSAVEGRDPDAEFDAIFSDATSPSGIPTRGFSLGDDDNPSAEELLTGLETPLSPDPLEAEDHTEVMTLGAVNTAIKDGNAFRDEQEIGSSEFEIVLDEGEPVDVKPVTPKRSPPPPVPPPSGSTNLDKRPSFLGRLFGRKDGPPAGDQ